MEIRFDVVKKYLRANQTFILVILLSLTSGTSIYFYSQLSELRRNPQKAVQEETRRLVAQISELIVLPSDEQPTVATVSDPEQLKDQPFFAKAKKGFKVIIYPKARKTILFDPFENRIIEVASVNIGAQPDTTLIPSLAPELLNNLRR